MCPVHGNAHPNAGSSGVRRDGPLAMTLFTRLLILFVFAAGFSGSPDLQAAPGDLQPIPPFGAYVTDLTGTLDAQQKQTLEQELAALQKARGSQIGVLMVPTTQPEDIAQYAIRVFDAWKLGRKGVDDGVLVLVAKDDRRARIQPGYGLEGAIPDATAARVIQEYMAPKFRDGDFGGGLVDATGVLVKLIDGEALPAPVSGNRARGEGSGGDWIFALFAAFIVAQVARGVLSRAPAPLRGVLGAGAAGGVAFLIAGALLVGGAGALIGLLLGLAHVPGGRYARHGGWGGFGGGGLGGGGFGGGGFGGGGGWSGGGGMSGGGGASGGW